ncbi:hypothetical protein E1301_Tti021845 [Triplophysa tibetana]|uniref:Uncharacterized protein n=1 Tax=Triplophysa tibetana TaxID=1572043 RepID=A0A5A9NBK3_9TELE|nr:hypothetical protein E1301_Tti021845 [Triplophysa tibetana]
MKVPSKHFRGRAIPRALRTPGGTGGGYLVPNSGQWLALTWLQRTNHCKNSRGHITGRVCRGERTLVYEQMMTLTLTPNSRLSSPVVLPSMAEVKTTTQSERGLKIHEY